MKSCGSDCECEKCTHPEIGSRDRNTCGPDAALAWYFREALVPDGLSAFWRAAQVFDRVIAGGTATPREAQLIIFEVARAASLAASETDRCYCPGVGFRSLAAEATA